MLKFTLLNLFHSCTTIGRYWANISDIVISGEFRQWKEGTTEVYRYNYIYIYLYCSLEVSHWKIYMCQNFLLKIFCTKDDV